MEKSHFKVIIVGGGIGGLALANSLQHAGIDYVLLEKGSVLDPEVGASIGILPNGARILDQLECFDDLSKLTVSMEKSASRRSDGSRIGEFSSALKLMERRTGYSVFFLDRRLLLQVLADHISDTNRIKLNTTVASVDQSSTTATVTCTDGTIYEGDVVVGADGVRSLVRSEMWRHADNDGIGKIFDKDREVMTAEYKCLFGISDSVPGMVPSETDRTYAKGMSTLSYVGKGGRLFWFIFIKMNQVYRPPQIPRFDKNDVEQLVDDIGSLAIRENVTLRDLYERQVACNLVAVEEAEYQRWFYGRLVCLGDSIHKMTPNLGAGASSAIEDAAVLSNTIVDLASCRKDPSASFVADRLEGYQKSRALRATRAMRFSNALTRIQALDNNKAYYYTHFIAPRMDDFAAEMFSSFVIGAPLIKHLPIPARSIQGMMPFNPLQGWGYEETKSSRAKRVVPLIVTTLLCAILLASKSSTWTDLSLPSMSVPFLNANPTSSDGILPTAVFNTLYGIWLMESTRLNNKMTLLQLPIFFAISAQYIGTSIIAPVFFLLLYIYTPIETFRATDTRLTDNSYTQTIAPLLVLTGIIPRLALGMSENQQVDSLCHYAITYQPIILAILQYCLSKFVIGSTIREDRLHNVRRDVPAIHRTVGILTILSIASWLYQTFSALSTAQLNSSILALIGQDTLLLSAAGLTWLSLVLRDLREAGMCDWSVAKASTLAIAALLFGGPATLILLGWVWRERVLIYKRHKGAIVSVHQKY